MCLVQDDGWGGEWAGQSLRQGYVTSLTLPFKPFSRHDRSGAMTSALPGNWDPSTLPGAGMTEGMKAAIIP
jgi:hypothetical protein